MKRLLVSIGIIAFSVMFSIAIVGPLLSTLADVEDIPLGPKPNTSIGVIFALGGLSLALAQIPFARLADKYGRKPFVITGSISVAITVLLIGYSHTTANILGLHLHLNRIGWDASTVTLATMRTLQGIAAAATWPVLLSIIASEIPEEKMGTAMGVFGASFGLGMSLGPVIGPVLASASNIHTPFIFSAILATIAALVALQIRETRRPILKTGESNIRLRDPRLIGLGLISFTLLYAMGSLVVIYPRYMVNTLNLGLDTLAIAMALASLTYSLLQPITGKLADKLDRRLLVGASHPLTGLAVLLAAFSTTPANIYISMLLFGIGGAIAFPAATAILGSIAPEGMEGAYTGVYNAMLSLGVTISPITIGLLADTAGYTAAFATVLPTVLAGTIAFLATNHHI